MKAGLLEIADILVVNKADREGAERAVQQFKGALSLRAHDRAKVPVLRTTATTGEGSRRWPTPSASRPPFAWPAIRSDRRRRRARYLIARAAADLIAERVKRGERRARRSRRMLGGCRSCRAKISLAGRSRRRSHIACRAMREAGGAFGTLERTSLSARPSRRRAAACR